MSVDKIDYKYVNECVRSFYIVLMENIIPYTLKRDFDEEFRDFETIEAFDCMEDEVTNVKRCVELYDVIMENPLLLLGDEDVEKLLVDFIISSKLSDSETISDSMREMINDYLERWVSGECNGC